jgi:hypothetical protein
MKHPTPEDWMDYLYHELPAEKAGTLDRHLRECPECQTAVASWKLAGTEMSHWSLTPQPSQWRTPARSIAWAAAAAAVVLLAAGAGRLTATRSTDTTQIARAIEPLVRAQVESELQHRVDDRVNAALERNNRETSQLVSQLIENVNSARASDRVEVINLLSKFETDQNARMAAMRADLETVAVVGESRLRSAQQEIGDLATISSATYHPVTQKQ